MDKEYEIYFPGNIKPEPKFEEGNQYRYCLEITNDECNFNCTLVTLLMNPSKAGLESSIFKNVYISDETVNLILQAFYAKYRKIIIFNVFPVMNSSSKDAKQYYSEHAGENLCTIKEHIENISNYDLLVATGDLTKVKAGDKEKYHSIMDFLSSKARAIRGRQLVGEGYAEHVNQRDSMSNNLNALIKNLIEYSWGNHELTPKN